MQNAEGKSLEIKQYELPITSHREKNLLVDMDIKDCFLPDENGTHYIYRILHQTIAKSFQNK